MDWREKRIRVLIADDHALFAEALAVTLQMDDRVDVVAHAVNGAEAVALAEVLEPDVVLMDLQMPVMDGIEATGLLRRASRRTRVIMVSASRAPAHAAHALAAGASRFLTKDTPALDLLDAVLEIGSAPAANLIPLRPAAGIVRSGSVA